MSKRVTQSYTPEFRTEAIKLVIEQGMSVAEVSSRLGVNQGTLADWATKARKLKMSNTESNGEQSVESLIAEVQRLRRELAEAKMEKEILKKATVDSICQRNTLSIICTCSDLI